MNVDFSPIIQFLNDMAEKLTPTAQRVFELAVRQTTIDGIVNLLLVLFLVTSTVCVWLFAIKKIKENEEADPYSYDELLPLVWMGIACAVTLVTSMFLFDAVRKTLSCFINPEYQTMLRLLKLIK